jgi:hypothetical protein
MSTHEALRVKVKFSTGQEMKMNAQEHIKSDESQLQADALTDLRVTDEQANRAKGGIESQGRLLMGTDNGLWK